MTSEFAIYMITRCDAINIVMAFLMVIFIVSFIINSIAVFVCIANHHDHINDVKTSFWVDNIKKFKRARNISLLFSAVFMVLYAAMPTTKEMAFIYVVPKIVNSEMVQKEIPKEVKELYFVAKDFLKQQTEIKHYKNTRVKVVRKTLQEEE